MAYANIPDSDIDADSPGNVSLFTRLRDNPEAIATGLAGATRIVTAAYDTGSVDQAAIGSSAVGQGELSTGTEERSSTGTVCASDAFNSPDGYGFFPEIRTSNGSYPASWCSHVTAEIAGSASTGYGTINLAKHTTNAAATAYMRIRYVNSSPPYDFGDGIVGRFVYAEIKPGGEIVRVANSEDPPWRGMVPKGRMRRDRSTGKVYVWRPTQALPAWGDAEGDNAAMDAYVAMMRTLEWGWVELTREMKMEPMARRPLPWASKAAPGNQQIIIDPPSDILHRIQQIMEMDSDLSPAALIHNGYLTIDNSSMAREGPPGVPVHGITWRATGR